ncbi:hypothetical protein ABGB19_24445 [Mycobacterium sp. B14F4]|uniref:hypothetical protein n=1 Tax=Mycobacterium sp. B14F4 TaxID=3153565 RepID=UPI00325F4DA5
MPWDEDGTDYDEPKSGGDSHEDEFDEEYGEQQPKGDADRAQADELAAAYAADIEFWENQGSDNRQQDPPAEPEYSPFAKSLGDFDDFSFEWAARSVAGALEDADQVSNVARLSSLEAEDFDWAESVSQVGPPAPDAPPSEPPADFDFARPFSEARDDTSVSFPFSERSPDRSEPRGLDQPETVEHVEPVGGAGSEPAPASSPSIEPASVFTDGAGDSGTSLSYQVGEPGPETIGFDPSMPDISATEFLDGPAPIYDPATEFEPAPDNSLQIDSTEFLG